MRPEAAAPAPAMRPASTDAVIPKSTIPQEMIVPLLAEDVVVTRRKIPRAVVRVAIATHTSEHIVDEEVVHERVQVERVPIGRYIEAPPPVRYENDVTVFSVVEEVVVVERKLVLREEVHVRRVRTNERFRQSTHLRRQEAVVTREPVPSAATHPHGHTKEFSS